MWRRTASRGELVAHHALHVGLDDGLCALGVAGEAAVVGGQQVVLQHGVGQDVVPTHGLLAVEEQQVAVLHILVHAVVVVDGPCEAVGGVKQVDTVGDVWTAAARKAEEGGHDVGLLGHGVAHAGGQLAGGGEEDNGHAEGAEGGVVGALLVDVGVVGGDDKEGVAVPRHAAGGSEEAAQGVVGIADAGMQRVAVGAETIGIAFGHDKGMMRCGGEEGGHERLRQLLHDGGVVLHELLVPDGPGAVEIVGSAETAVGFVLGTAIVVLETGGAGKGLEAHGTVFGTVEEGSGVALVRQLAGYAADVVERVASDEEGFDKHGYAGEDGGHTVDALAAVGIGMAEGEAVGDERV